jgi:hypothetical protein
LSRRYFGVVASVSAGSGMCVSPYPFAFGERRLNAMADRVNNEALGVASVVACAIRLQIDAFPHSIEVKRR